MSQKRSQVRLGKIASVAFVILWYVILVGCGGILTNHAKKITEMNATGQFDEALAYANKRLSDKPDDEKVRALASTSYQGAVKLHTGQIESLEASSDTFKWDNIVAEYEQLIKNQQRAQRIGISNNATNYAQGLSEAKTNAAEGHYQEGLKLAESLDDRETQKQAAKQFTQAMSFVADYKDAQSSYEACREKGTTKMAILPFEDKSGKGEVYGAIGATIADHVISGLINDPVANEFLEIVTRDQLAIVMNEIGLANLGGIDNETASELGKKLRAHEIVTGQITQILYSEPRTVRNTEAQEQTKYDVVGTERYVDKKGKTKTRDVYANVTYKANVTFYTKETSASIVGSYKIIDAETAEIKKSDNFKESHKFVVEWMVYKGDEKALSGRAEKLKGKTEPIPPSKQEIVFEAQNKLTTELTKALKMYVLR